MPSRQAHVGSSGFTNYNPSGRSQTQEYVNQLLDEHPDWVIIDGNDDWGASRYCRPESFVLEILGLEKIEAWFHTGISGMSKSGAIIDKKYYEELEKGYEEKYGGRISSFNRVYKR